MEDRVVVEGVVVLRARGCVRRLPENPPLEEADVDAVDERVDEEQPEHGHREEHEGIAPTGFAHARPEERTTIGARDGLGCARHEPAGLPARRAPRGKTLSSRSWVSPTARISTRSRHSPGEPRP